MDYADPVLADTLAAQYVAGTLRGPARRRFETLLPGHPALRAAVRTWQDQLMPLTAVLAPQAPPAGVWRAIERRLWPAATAEVGRSASGAAAASSWWQRLAVWRGLSVLATVAAVGFAVLLANPPRTQAPVIVVLQGTGADPLFAGSIVASVSADGRALRTATLTPVAVGTNRSLELWSVPPQGAPRSLGLIAPDGSTVLAPGSLPPTLLKGGTETLAVSVEPQGGSRTGAPTGPVVFAGKLQL